MPAAAPPVATLAAAPPLDVPAMFPKSAGDVRA